MLEKKWSKKILQDYINKDEFYWESIQYKTLRSIFLDLSRNVKSYKKLLKTLKIKVNDIKSNSDFIKLPVINKTNYFRNFPLPDTVRKKSYEKEALVFTATSGSTGQPTYFARNEAIDLQYSILAEFFLNNSAPGSTLLIDCFGMGIWIGGLITYQAFRMSSLRGRPLSIITPGINKKEIFQALKELAPNFKNVIIAGYPPFVKDLLDEAELEKINLKKIKIRTLFAAESFTEKFRDHVCKKANIKNVYNDTLNIYGSAEMGAMAFETPGTIFIRRLAKKNKKIFKELFPNEGSPTLAQYNPQFNCFEKFNNKILISAPGATPFLKYDIGDTGGVYKLSEILNIFCKFNIDLLDLAKKEGVKILSLPFVYIDVRSDFATKLYGAIIHTEPIVEALQKSDLNKFFTGKFTMITKTDKKHNQFLEINLELKKEQVETVKLKELTKKNIIKNLLRSNSEYKNNYNSIKNKVEPVIQLWKNESSPYFNSNGKQKWIIKDSNL